MFVIFVVCVSPFGSAVGAAPFFESAVRTAVPEKKFDSRIITGCGYLCLLLISVLQCGILFADILRHFYPHCVKLFVKCGFRKRKHLSRKYRGVGRTVDGNSCHGHSRGHLHRCKQGIKPVKR